MPPPLQIDRSIDRLDDALREAGLDVLVPPPDTQALDEIAAAVAPWALPADLDRFWRRVDLDRFCVTSWTMAALADPTSALVAHRLNLEPEVALLYGPPLLFPIARHAESQWSVELGTEWTPGGTVFSHDDVIRLEYPSFAGMVETWAELIEEGAFERDRGGWSVLSHEAEQRKQTDRLRTAGPHPLYGEIREFPNDPARWPEHWLAAAGIDLRDREPLGTTHTIAELAAAAVKAPVDGRIAGEVVRLVGTGSGDLVLVDDGTGALDVWCPAGTSPWGPLHRQRFEFAVHVGGPVAPPPDFDSGPAEIQRHALAGSLDAAQAAAGAFFGELLDRTPAAVATAVRPLEPRDVSG